MKISSFNFLLILTLACKSPPKPRWIPPAWSPSNIVKAATTYVEKQTERVGDIAKSTVETAKRVATDPVGFAEDTANAVKNQAVGLVDTVKSAAECTSKGDLNCLKEAGESYANDMVEMAKDPGGVINDMVNNPEDLAAGALIGGGAGVIGKKLIGKSLIGKKFTSSKSKSTSGKSTCPCCRKRRSVKSFENLYNQVLNTYRLQHRIRRAERPDQQPAVPPAEQPDVIPEAGQPEAQLAAQPAAQPTTSYLRNYDPPNNRQQRTRSGTQPGSHNDRQQTDGRVGNFQRESENFRNPQGHRLHHSDRTRQNKQEAQRQHSGRRC